MMVSLPWQVLVAAIIANAIVIVGLILQLRDRADRVHQRAGLADRTQEQDVERIIRLIRLGYETRRQIEIQRESDEKST